MVMVLLKIWLWVIIHIGTGHRENGNTRIAEKGCGNVNDDNRKCKGKSKDKSAGRGWHRMFDQC